MNEEIRTEEIIETDIAETEDVNEGLTATDYAVIGGLMAAGALVFEGGKWVWKKTAKPRGKVADWCRAHKPGKKAKAEAETPQDQEGSVEKVDKKSEVKKTEDKKSKK